MKKRVIEVVDYCECWEKEFLDEKSLIQSTLSRSNTLHIHHIGSTSVKGLCAKPTIDILLEVESLDVLDAESHKMETIGYEVKGEFGIKDRRYFQKGVVEHSYHIHAFTEGSYEIKRHLAFRNYLIAFPAIRDEYCRLKQKGATLYKNDIEKYINYKNSFIQHHEKEALKWQHSSQNPTT